jgi:PAS domain S-box-containing protein
MNTRVLNPQQLLDVLFDHNNAVAIYTSEDIIIESANKAMLKFWGKDTSIIGKPLGEALPEIKDQPFVEMLRAVLTTGIDDIGEGIKADLEVDGRLQTFYFDYEYRAVKNDRGEVYAILHTATDVTERVIGKEAIQDAKLKEEQLQREQMLNEELSASIEELFVTNEELGDTQHRLNLLNLELEKRVAERTIALTNSEARMRYLLEDAPVAIAVFNGRELIIESANKKVLEAWGKTETVVGKPLRLAVPELVGQDFLRILEDVYATGIPFYGNEIKALINVGGALKEVYSNFVYQPILDEDGKVNSIMLTASIVTEQVEARESIEALNEELSAINHELTNSQETLLQLNKSIKDSQAMLDKILSELPTPIVVLEGINHIITTTNSALLKFWNKTKEEVMGKPMLQVFPELVHQQFPYLWKNVLETGKSLIDKEQPVKFRNNDGSERLHYVDYYYQRLSGNEPSVLATVIDVTDKVISRRQIEQAEAKLRLAVDSSGLGTWYLNMVTGEFVPSERYKQIMGFDKDEKLTNDLATAVIADEFKSQVLSAVSVAMESGEGYDMEFPIITYDNKELKWIKATGKVYETSLLGEANFSGVVQDITERKLEEQRKDDFLSIASHELKTPITTLKGSLQLLNRYKENLDHPMVPRLIDQANKGVFKITSLIDDLLNTTRTNEGQLHLNYVEFNMASMLNQSCNHIRIGDKHDLVIKGDTSLSVFADEQRLEQVIVNFVNNAAKYAPNSRTINLIVEKVDDQIKVSVQDFGKGIPKDKIPHLFERYYRADYGGTQYSGLGLGLYISSEIIKRHGGQIGVDSVLGRGSTFWFKVPIAK